MISNRLFIVCPFSCMEQLLQYRYGNNCFFLTFSGAILPYEEIEFLSAIRQFILNERIKTISFVNDTSCRFINAIIHRNRLFGLPPEKVMEDLYIDHYFSDFKDQSIRHQQLRLAELNIKEQISRMLNTTPFGSFIHEHDIEVNGLITSKEMKLYLEIHIENKHRIHEY